MQAWLIWLLIGLICVGLEIFIPGLVIIFFGIGAVLIAPFSLIPVMQNNIWLQVFLFTLFSVLALILLRKKFKNIFAGTIFHPSESKDSANNKFGEVIEPVSEKKEGRIKFDGTTWSAFSIAGDIAPGEIVEVVRREGLTYFVKKSEN